MNHRRSFEIAFVGLKPGIHSFEYAVEDEFFEDYGKQDFDNCNVKVNVTLEKNTSLMLLKFDISGTVDVLCDRCANTLTENLWDEFNIIVKMVASPDEMNEQEEDPDIFYIGFNESHLQMADWIYEFINLSIPAQRFCGEDEKGNSKCNPEVLKKLAQMKADADHISTHEIWKGLEKLKNSEENTELN